MTKDELIVKQQLEIEDLKAEAEGANEVYMQAARQLIHAEQWNPKCKDFPRVAMSAIVTAREMLESI